MDIPSAKEVLYSMLQVRKVPKGIVFKGIMSTVNVRSMNASRRLLGTLCGGSLEAPWRLRGGSAEDLGALREVVERSVSAR